MKVTCATRPPAPTPRPESIKVRTPAAGNLTVRPAGNNIQICSSGLLLAPAICWLALDCGGEGRLVTSAQLLFRASEPRECREGQSSKPDQLAHPAQLTRASSAAGDMGCPEFGRRKVFGVTPTVSGGLSVTSE